MTAIQYDASQLAAIDMVTTEPISIITGGPGTGKSTILFEVLRRLRAAGQSFALAAPTGKAAKRMSEATNVEAVTIHRLLGYNPEERGFYHGADNPLGFDVVILDEASMIDVALFSSLLDAIDETRTRLVLVGDANQLPSVGPGAILADLVKSDLIPCAQLTNVHRSAADSWICTTAPKVLAGESFDLTPLDDFRFIGCDAAPNMPQHVGNAYAELGAQILVPQKTGKAGADAINLALQARFNPPRAREQQWGYKDNFIRPRDPVIHTRNNYDLEVFNGECGVVLSIDAETLVVEYPDKRVNYSKSAARDLKLSYALTIHKCLAGDTIVGTGGGLVYARDLASAGTVETADGPRVCTGFFRNEVSNMLRLETERGYEVTVSEEHGMESWTGERYERVEARHLKPGDWLRMPVEVPDAVIQAPKLPPAPPLGPRTKPVRFPQQMTHRLAQWLGLMVADGTMFGGGIRLAKRHLDVVNHFESLTMDLFGRVSGRFSMPGSEAVELCSRPVVAWLKDIGGLEPKKKAVPACIRQSPHTFQAAFLRGLFEDGSVALNRRGEVDHVEWSTAYPEMSELVQVMLLRLGIASSRAAYGGAWRVSIYPDSLDAFAQLIGFVSQSKTDRLSIGWSDTGLQRRRVPVSSGDIPKGQESWKQNARSRGYMSEESARTHHIAGNRIDFLHVRITDITSSTGPSYCVEVPEGNRFIQNGFDGWNSQGSEWPWVIVVAHSTHSYMLTRQLLYTAITRGKAGVCIVGNEAGIKQALKTKKDSKRNTALCDRIRGEL